VIIPALRKYHTKKQELDPLRPDHFPRGVTIVILFQKVKRFFLLALDLLNFHGNSTGLLVKPNPQQQAPSRQESRLDQTEAFPPQDIA